jgi:hypothetical protein
MIYFSVPRTPGVPVMMMVASGPLFWILGCTVFALHHWLMRRSATADLRVRQDVLQTTDDSCGLYLPGVSFQFNGRWGGLTRS